MHFILHSRHASLCIVPIFSIWAAKASTKSNILHRALSYHPKEKCSSNSLNVYSMVCLEIWKYTRYYFITSLILWLQLFILFKLHLQAKSKNFGLLFFACLWALNKATNICCFYFKNTTLHFYSLLLLQKAVLLNFQNNSVNYYYIRKETKDES